MLDLHNTDDWHSLERSASLLGVWDHKAELAGALGAMNERLSMIKRTARHRD
jgi:hypothetical protein